MRLSRWLAELRRRRVYHVGVAYLVVGLGVLGAAELILDPLGLGYVRPAIVVLTLVGFPIALVLAWAYELRPETTLAEPDPVGAGAATPAESAGPGEAPTPGGPRRREQEIRFCTTADGVGIAYSQVGEGPPLVRVLGWFTHLEEEWRWPELRFFWERLAERFTVVRYDGRGIGVSDPWDGPFTEETGLLDLEAVLDAAEVERGALLALSEGGWTAASYAVRRPERVSHLVFYGCYSRGLPARSGYDREEDDALMTLMRKGWGRRDPAFRQVFTSTFFPPDADPDLLAHFNELQRASADGETAARYVRAVHHDRGDGREIFERVGVPSLVLHRRGDRTVPFEEGRRVAALIPGATFTPLRGTDHYFPIDRDSADEVAGLVTRFVEGTDEASHPSGSDDALSG